MKREIIFFTPRDAEHGFRLAGFAQQTCTTEELEPLLEKYVQKPEYGLYVIDERLLTDISEKRLRELERGLNLVFVVMPPPFTLETSREDYAVRLLRKAIGYHIQLNI